MTTWLSRYTGPHQGLTLVHFSAQPKPFWSHLPVSPGLIDWGGNMYPTYPTTRACVEPKLDECKPLGLTAELLDLDAVAVELEGGHGGDAARRRHVLTPRPHTASPFHLNDMNRFEGSTSIQLALNRGSWSPLIKRTRTKLLHPSAD